MVKYQADNLTISVPIEYQKNKKPNENPFCNKNCGYCVSKMTGFNEPNEQLMVRNIKKIISIAISSDINSVLFTGKGEPLLNIDYLTKTASELSMFPLEIQTNGLLLNEETIEKLYLAGFNVISISVDHENYFTTILPDRIPLIHKYNMLIRLSLNINDKLASMTMNEIIEFCRTYKVNQLLLRKLSIPIKGKDNAVELWIDKHAPDKLFDTLQSELSSIIHEHGKLIRKLNQGIKIYDVFDISVTVSDYCIQETSNEENLRSLIFEDDGHLYTSWNSKASAIL